MYRAAPPPRAPSDHVMHGAFWGGGGIQHSPGTPTTGLCERGNDISKSTGRSGRQNAATRRNMRRAERVTVQGPVKEQQPDGMSHRGGGGQKAHPVSGLCTCRVCGARPHGLNCARCALQTLHGPLLWEGTQPPGGGSHLNSNVSQILCETVVRSLHGGCVGLCLCSWVSRQRIW